MKKFFEILFIVVIAVSIVLSGIYLYDRFIGFEVKTMSNGMETGAKENVINEIKVKEITTWEDVIIEGWD